MDMEIIYENKKPAWDECQFYGVVLIDHARIISVRKENEHESKRRQHSKELVFHDTRDQGDKPESKHRVQVQDASRDILDEEQSGV